MRLTFIVTYDIRCDKWLRRVFRICKDFGMHLQYSVFECDLTATDKLHMEGRLKEVMNESEDQVLFFELGPASQRGERRISALGQSYTKIDAPCFIA